MELSKLLKTQISLTEWFANIKHERTDEIRQEDNKKRDRMGKVSEIIDFPFDKPTRFLATEVRDKTKDFLTWYAEHKHELCALRLVPLEPGPPKIRMRGMSIEKTTKEWFAEQDIQHELYSANYIPHPNPDCHLWSTIFIVNENGIFGEIIAASHELLTQGFYKEIKPITFFYDYSEWHLSEEDDEALVELKRLIAYLHVEDRAKQFQLKESVNATFVHDYMAGYFETTTSSDLGPLFIDYNRVLGDLYKDYSSTIHDEETSALVKGQTGSPGVIEGKVRIVKSEDILQTIIESGDIIVCDMTSPNYVILMKQAAGVITNRGGILTHAAIVSRELGIPCLVGTGNATEVLKEGQNITLNATDGIVI